MEAYKYGEGQWIDALTEAGSVRIGTLWDFRRIEHKAGIADPDEGKKSVFHPMQREMLRAGSPTAAFFGFNIDPGVAATFTNCSFEREEGSPDLFIYCLATRFARSVRRQFPDADACAGVMSLGGFVAALTMELHKRVPVRHLVTSRVVYEERKQFWRGIHPSAHPALIKAPSFRPQAELRIIWAPLASNASIQPMNIERSDAFKHCRRISFSNPSYDRS
jgi:hypothetical protein